MSYKRQPRACGFSLQYACQGWITDLFSFLNQASNRLIMVCLLMGQGLQGMACPLDAHSAMLVSIQIVNGRAVSRNKHHPLAPR